MRFLYVLLIWAILPHVLLGQTRPEQQAPAQNKSNEAKTAPPVSSVNPQPAAPTQQNKPDQQTPKCPPWTDPFWSNWALVAVGLGATWAALGTLSDIKKQTEAAKITAEAAKKSAEIADLSLRSVERADVLLNACSATSKLPNGADFRVLLQFKNFGRTRAKEVRFSLHLAIEGVPETDCEAIPPIAMGAGETKDVSSEPFGNFLTTEAATAIFTGKIPLKFEGGAVYKDMFGCPHRVLYTGTYDWGARCFRIDSQNAD